MMLGLSTKSDLFKPNFIEKVITDSSCIPLSIVERLQVVISVNANGDRPVSAHINCPKAVVSTPTLAYILHQLTSFAALTVVETGRRGRRGDPSSLLSLKRVRFVEISNLLSHHTFHRLVCDSSADCTIHFIQQLFIVRKMVPRKVVHPAR